MTPSAEPEPLSSVHTTSLPALLEQIGASLLITTYQAGKLIAVRADEGRANTHFRGFNTPMGLALEGNRLALCALYEVWELQNMPAVARTLEPPGRHDGCYVPRSRHFTGRIAAHEMAYAGGELWIVNTRFSCLCTLDRDNSFVPRWRPPFVTALAAEDRCHLNGLAVVDGQPRYVTALGATDTAGGWRPTKATGGVLMEVPSGRVVVGGLSMPHSPRWYDGRLWFLESGAGTLAVADPQTGRVDVIAQLPGFTRGLDFWGPLAFIGLSQVRETAVFSGIPITERLPVEERACGMWVVNTRTGQTVAFLQFKAGVQEVFAVQVLLGVRFPEILTEDEARAGDAFMLPADAVTPGSNPKP
jgi:uncharacterized protein (TIGR03032 family)